VEEGRPRKRVVVIGAGIAGLVAAHELKRLGTSRSCSRRTFELAAHEQGRSCDELWAD
jgi:cation diffusion facilitator CzcD-associated flavoprotein CzcO